jgi:hypothetical protein
MEQNVVKGQRTSNKQKMNQFYDIEKDRVIEARLVIISK